MDNKAMKPIMEGLQKEDERLREDREQPDGCRKSFEERPAAPELPHCIPHEKTRFLIKAIPIKSITQAIPHTELYPLDETNLNIIIGITFANRRHYCTFA